MCGCLVASCGSSNGPVRASATTTTMAAAATLSAATAPTTVTPPTSTPPDFYVIQKGDTLSSIAAKFNVSAAVLAEYNHLKNPDKIKWGLKLKIPPPGTTRSTTTVPGAAVPASGESAATPDATGPVIPGAAGPETSAP
jgi:LysM repeat protein